MARDLASTGIVTAVARRRDGRRARGRPRFRSLPARALALAMVLLPYATSGCYTYAAVSAAPDPGTVIVLDINDQGRVALGPRLGAELARVEGVLVERLDTAYVIRMRQARTLGGTTTHWAGELVDLDVDYVKDVGERQFSRSRTFFAAAGAVLAVGLLIAGQSLIGAGSGDDRGGGGPPGQER